MEIKITKEDIEKALSELCSDFSIEQLDYNKYKIKIGNDVIIASEPVLKEILY